MFQQLRDELGDGGTLLIILLSLLILYRVTHLYLQTIF